MSSLFVITLSLLFFLQISNGDSQIDVVDLQNNDSPLNPDALTQVEAVSAPSNVDQLPLKRTAAYNGNVAVHPTKSNENVDTLFWVGVAGCSVFSISCAIFGIALMKRQRRCD